MSRIGKSYRGSARNVIVFIALGWQAAFTAAQCLDDTILSDDGTSTHHDIELLGDTLFVGAHWETSDLGARGVVRVYTHDGQDWIKTGEIASPNSAFAREFGYDIEPIDATHLLVSDPGDDGGVVWELEYTGTEWVLLDQIRPDNPDYFARFGHSIAAWGNALVIGAPGDDSFDTGQGVVSLYERDSDGWDFKRRFAQRDLDDIDFLWWSVDIGDEIAVVGGWSGSLAYSYSHSGSNWVRKGRLTLDDPDSAQRFGRGVHIFADSAAVSDSQAGLDYTGRVYLYHTNRSGEIKPYAYLDPWFDDQNTEFGTDITSRNNWLLVQDSQGVSGPDITYVFRHELDDLWLPYLAIEQDESDNQPRFRDIAANDDWLAAAGQMGSDSGVILHSLRPRCLCPADFNEDGSINPADVLAFLNAWNAGDDAADVNQDGSLDTRDVVWFLQVWGQAGSCEN